MTKNTAVCGTFLSFFSALSARQTELQGVIFFISEVVFQAQFEGRASNLGHPQPKPSFLVSARYLCSLALKLLIFLSLNLTAR